MLTLYGRSSNNITLPNALKDCAPVLFNDSQGIALLYSPKCCQFAKLQSDGTLTDANQKDLDLKDVFEARVFNKIYELRWLNTLSGEGRAVLISEKTDISSYFEDNIATLELLNTIENQYIIWGETVKKIYNSGWGKVAKSRIGSLDVPVTVSKANQRVYLTAVEYLKADDEYGNVSVVEERLIRLEVR